MRSFTVALLAGTFAVGIGTAKAADVYTGAYIGADQPLVQDVRMVCNDAGQCFQTRGGRRVIIEHRDSYDYYPRERYYDRRYRDWDDGPRAGIGFRAPGVSVGVGVNNDRW